MLNELAAVIYDNNVKKGFYEEPVQTGTRLMLVTSELAEALEADRKNRYAGNICAFYEPEETITVKDEHDNTKTVFETMVKDKFEDEIADAIIRLLDLSVHMNIDIDWHVKAKMAYNATRPYKHNKAY